MNIRSIIVNFFSFKVLFIVSLCLRIISFLFVKILKEPKENEFTDAIRLFGQSVVNDIVTSFNNIIHYILVPIDSITNKKNNK